MLQARCVYFMRAGACRVLATRTSLRTLGSGCAKAVPDFRLPARGSYRDWSSPAAEAGLQGGLHLLESAALCKAWLWALTGGGWVVRVVLGAAEPAQRWL